MASISIIATSKRVVNSPGFTIDEFAGNVSSKSDKLSIAHVHAAKGTCEPYLTIDYDEWICLLKGKMLFESKDGSLTATAGDTVKVKKGARFRPSFLEDSEYVPVCLPAFSPSLCTREDENEEGKHIAENLKELHKKDQKSPDPCSDPEKPEILYHMTTKREWEQAKEKNCAYFPKTFEKDGFYTHATAVPERLIEVANHFYQDVEGEWICLQFRRSVLHDKFGIVVKDEDAMPVGNKKVDEDWKTKHWICPHVYAGLPLECVEKIYSIVRAGTKFIRIEGLTN